MTKSRTFEETVAQLKSEYGLEIISTEDRAEFMLDYEPPDPKDAQNFVDYFYDEISIYQPAVIKNSNLTRIVVCTDLKTMGRHVAGITKLAEVRLFGLFKNTMFLEVDFCGTPFGRSVIHHELYHAIDYHDDFWGHIDRDWEKLNQKGFKYDPSIATGCTPIEGSGFLTDYSMLAVVEDKAEVYAHLIVDYRGTVERTESDLILKQKINRMKSLLKSYSSTYDDAFWERRNSTSVSIYDIDKHKPRLRCPRTTLTLEFEKP